MLVAGIATGGGYQGKAVAGPIARIVRTRAWREFGAGSALPSERSRSRWPLVRGERQRIASPSSHRA